MRTQPKVFYTAEEPGGGGGTPLEPTLEQLTDPNYKPAAAPIEGVNPDGSLQDGYQKGEDGVITKIDANPPVEGLNEDGTIQEGYQKNADATITKLEPPAEDDEAPPADDSAALYEEVAKITGEPVEVDFGEVDPLSAEGVAMRDKVIREQGALDFEAYLKQTDPRAYAYMLHRDAGGDDESFFAKKTFVLPDEETFKSDIEAQKSIIIQDLIDRGIEPEIADAQVTNYIKNNLLTEKATAAYTAKKDAQVQQLAQIEEERRKDQDQLSQAVNELAGTIAKNINEGSIRFVIPDTKKAAFNTFVRENLRYDAGKFYLTTEINSENAKEVLEGQFFQFSKGDLSAIVARQAKTQTVQRLRSAVQRAGQTKVKDTSGGGSPTEFVPLGSI